MKARLSLIAAALLGAGAGGAVVYLNLADAGRKAYAQVLPTHQAPLTKDGNVVVQLCDGVTAAEVKGLKPGQEMSRGQAMAVTGKLMAEWQHKHPDQHWVIAQAENEEASPAAASSDTGEGSQNVSGSSTTAASELKTQQSDTYASFQSRDYMIWKAQTDDFVAYGKKVFHSAKLLGGTIGVSCDMCHPDASNTHPETYPKYQVQLQRVALLRDMIDWCIENPVRGKTLPSDDAKLRALEAYIIAQRNGVPIAYGKH